jgi:hypothetical protein
LPLAIACAIVLRASFELVGQPSSKDRLHRAASGHAAEQRDELAAFHVLSAPPIERIARFDMGLLRAAAEGPSRSVSSGLTEWQDPRVRATIGRRTPWKADALAAKSGID